MSLIAIAGSASKAYWQSVRAAIGVHGLGLRIVDPKQWRSGKVGANPKKDTILTSGAHVEWIDDGYRVLAIAEGNPVERKHTWWIARSQWQAAQWSGAGGQAVSRIIGDGVDVDTYFPAERQRLRTWDPPVILRCRDDASPDDLRDADILFCADVGDTNSPTVPRAIASDVVVVGHDAGFLWHFGQAQCFADLKCNVLPALGVVTWVKGVSKHTHALKVATDRRHQLHGRRYARRWLRQSLVGAKWLEAIALRLE